MGVTIQIREVDPVVRDRLKARAAAGGDSLNSYLKRLLTAAAEKPDREELYARLRSRSERSPVSATELIRAQREAREPSTS